MLASKCRTRWHGWRRRRRRQWREERTGWQLACQSGGRTASTSCSCLVCVGGDRESCLVSLSTPGNNTSTQTCMFMRYAWPHTLTGAQCTHLHINAASKARFQGCFISKVICTISTKPKSQLSLSSLVCVCSISQVRRLIQDAKCSAAV